MLIYCRSVGGVGEYQHFRCSSIDDAVAAANIFLQRLGSLLATIAFEQGPKFRKPDLKIEEEKDETLIREPIYTRCVSQNTVNLNMMSTVFVAVPSCGSLINLMIHLEFKKKENLLDVARTDAGTLLIPVSGGRIVTTAFDYYG